VTAAILAAGPGTAGPHAMILVALMIVAFVVALNLALR
jgi:hypothetical protein